MNSWNTSYLGAIDTLLKSLTLLEKASKTNSFSFSSIQQLAIGRSSFIVTLPLFHAIRNDTSMDTCTSLFWVLDPSTIGWASSLFLKSSSQRGLRLECCLLTLYFSFFDTSARPLWSDEVRMFSQHKVDGSVVMHVSQEKHVSSSMLLRFFAFVAKVLTFFISYLFIFVSLSGTWLHWPNTG